MSLLKDIADRGACVAWSPIRAKGGVLATGTKEGAGGGFDDYGGTLDLSMLNFEVRDKSVKSVGSVKTSARFASIAWGDVGTHKGPHKGGLIAGGMTDGVINLWDPEKVMAGAEGKEGGADSALVTRIEGHKSAVTSLQFNPHAGARHMFASGSARGDTGIFNLERATPARMAPLTNPGGSSEDEITAVAWNTEVKHILGTATGAGVAVVWDLRTCKPWAQIRDPRRNRMSDIAWHPDEGLYLVTATDDDRNPSLRLWDLRASTTTPLAELMNHSAGVLSCSWCPHDSALLVSCGKDNRTLLWDLTTCRVVATIDDEPAVGSPAGAGGGFGASDVYGSVGPRAGGGRRYDVQWSPCVPAVLSTCSFDRRVQVFGLSGAAAGTARPPRWLRRPVGAAQGFGGKILSFGFPGASKVVKPGQQPPRPPTRVLVSQAPRDEAFAEKAQAFADAVEGGDFRGFCESRASTAADARSRREWSFMRVLFESEARTQLLRLLGYDAEAVANDVRSFVASKDGGAAGAAAAAGAGAGADADGEAKADDVFGASAAAGGESTAGDAATNGGGGAKSPAAADASGSGSGSCGGGVGGGGGSAGDAESDAMLRRCLMVADFDAAVDCCLAVDRMADALLIASNGSRELWARTIDAYFQRRASPLMGVLSAVMKNELGTLVAEAPVGEWEQTLAIITRYASPEEFPGLCNDLGDRLQSSDAHSATLCYMCAVNIEKTMAFWVREAEAAAAVRGLPAALQELVEKATLFREAAALGASAADGADPAAAAAAAYAEGPQPESHLTAMYASLLAAQGDLALADRFASRVHGDVAEGCTGSVGAVLRDRIVRAQPPTPEADSTPFPYEMTNVNVSASVAEHEAIKAAGGHPGAAGAAGGGGGGGWGAPAADPAAAAAAAAGGGGWGAAPGAPGGVGGVGGGHPAPGAAAGGWGAHGAHAAHGGHAHGHAHTHAHAAAAPAPAPATHAPAHGHAHAHGGWGGAPAAGGAAPATAAAGGWGGAAGAGAGVAGGARPGMGGAPATHAMPGRPAPAAAAPAPAPAPAPVPARPGAAAVGAASSSGAAAGTRSALPTDGFVSTVGNPARGAAYGNAFTGAHPGSAVPGAAGGAGGGAGAGGAAAAPAAPVERALQESEKAIVDALQVLIQHLNGAGLKAMEGRKLKEGSDAVNMLQQRMARDAIGAGIVEQLTQLAEACRAFNFAMALHVHTQLSTSEWADHKDWLKGLKFLLQLGQSKLHG